jgi:hypothetical protein
MYLMNFSKSTRVDLPEMQYFDIVTSCPAIVISHGLRRFFAGHPLELQRSLWQGSMERKAGERKSHAGLATLKREGAIMDLSRKTKRVTNQIFDGFHGGYFTE